MLPLLRAMSSSCGAAAEHWLVGRSVWGSGGIVRVNLRVQRVIKCTQRSQHVHVQSHLGQDVAILCARSNCTIVTVET